MIGGIVDKVGGIEKLTCSEGSDYDFGFVIFNIWYSWDMPKKLSSKELEI